MVGRLEAVHSQCHYYASLSCTEFGREAHSAVLPKCLQWKSFSLEMMVLLIRFYSWACLRNGLYWYCIGTNVCCQQTCKGCMEVEWIFKQSVLQMLNKTVGSNFWTSLCCGQESESASNVWCVQHCRIQQQITVTVNTNPCALPSPYLESGLVYILPLHRHMKCEILFVESLL